MAGLNANRKRRLLRRLDNALAALGVSPRRPAATPAARTVERREKARREAADAQRGYNQLRTAIQAQGGIRPNRDYPAREIPPELRAKPGRGLAPDEMAATLSAHGFHYDGDTALFADIDRRRERARSGRALTSRTRSRTKGGQTVCGPVRRGPDGRFLPVR